MAAFSACVRSCKEEVLAPEGDDAQRAFGGVVVDFQLAVVDISRERGPAYEGIADRRRRIGLAGERGERGFEPGVQVGEKRFSPGLTDGLADFRRAASDLGFDGIECGDALDGLGCRRQRMGNMDLVELAPRVRPASRFDDGSIFVEMLEAGVGVGLERPLVELQMPLRMFALAVG